jgi:hypothetical protein
MEKINQSNQETYKKLAKRIRDKYRYRIYESNYVGLISQQNIINELLYTCVDIKEIIESIYDRDCHYEDLFVKIAMRYLDILEAMSPGAWAIDFAELSRRRPLKIKDSRSGHLLLSLTMRLFDIIEASLGNRTFVLKTFFTDFLEELIFISKHLPNKDFDLAEKIKEELLKERIKYENLSNA